MALKLSLAGDYFVGLHILGADSDDGFDAIVYPSVKMGGQVGLNVAIRPD